VGNPLADGERLAFQPFSLVIAVVWDGRVQHYFGVVSSAFPLSSRGPCRSVADFKTSLDFAVSKSRPSVPARLSPKNAAFALSPPPQNPFLQIVAACPYPIDSDEPHPAHPQETYPACKLWPFLYFPSLSPTKPPRRWYGHQAFTQGEIASSSHSFVSCQSLSTAGGDDAPPETLVLFFLFNVTLLVVSFPWDYSSNYFFLTSRNLACTPKNPSHRSKTPPVVASGLVYHPSPPPSAPKPLPPKMFTLQLFQHFFSPFFPPFSRLWIRFL